MYTLIAKTPSVECRGITTCLSNGVDRKELQSSLRCNVKQVEEMCFHFVTSSGKISLFCVVVCQTSSVLFVCLHWYPRCLSTYKPCLTPTSYFTKTHFFCQQSLHSQWSNFGPKSLEIVSSSLHKLWVLLHKMSISAFFHCLAFKNTFKAITGSRSLASKGMFQHLISLVNVFILQGSGRGKTVGSN